jgi:hypothetical protein
MYFWLFAFLLWRVQRRYALLASVDGNSGSGYFLVGVVSKSILANIPTMNKGYLSTLYHGFY